MRRALVFITALAALTPLAAHAEGPEVVGARISTLGVGAEFGYRIAPNWSIRAIANGYNQNYHTTSDNIDYRGELKLGSFGIQADYHLSETNPFYLTVGLYGNGNKIDATATPTTTTNIGGVPFTPEQIGTLTGRAKYKSTAPYLGLGWRWTTGAVSWNLEAGAYFQGSPNVTLTSNGTYASNPTYQQALEQERQTLKSDLDDLKTWPVVAFGVGYHF